MNKQDLASSIAKKFELSKVKSNELVKYVLELIQASLVKGKPVSLIGFGSFTVKKRAARKGRNPQTGESIKVAARKVVRFVPGKALKESVNKK